jgi:hypothetical protein
VKDPLILVLICVANQDPSLARPFSKAGQELSYIFFRCITVKVAVGEAGVAFFCVKINGGYGS